jgi:acetyl-CoA carboxylase, biotin carboxylase subunit
MTLYRRILIANRGEIAVRIQRTCRAMGIETVALYTATDQNSLHVRLADQCVLLASPEVFSSPEAIIQIASATHADAIHPGYGFLAERADFIKACELAGFAFIGPPADIVEAVTNKIAVLECAQQAGFPVIHHSRECYDDQAFDALAAEADRMGYPVVIKSSLGGRGRGERLVMRPESLRQAVSRAQAESYAVYGQRSVYLEKAIMPAHQINVQMLGDAYGQRIHLGEREGSIILGNEKLFEESPAPCLTSTQRSEIWNFSLELAALYHLQNASAIEFLVDASGQIYFTEIKPRIQVEHSLTESLSRLDLVSEQIRLACGERLGYQQEQINLHGWSMECRVTAEDPLMGFLPSPGQLQNVRLPGGQEIRIDTFVSSGCEISSEYDSLIAKLTVWAPDRESCLGRVQCALDECKLIGLPTNLPLLQALLSDLRIINGEYDTNLSVISLADGSERKLGTLESQSEVENSDKLLRDLAVATAVYYLRRNQSVSSELPERLNTGWHRNSRRLSD